jgi:hypothetical protein
MRIFLSGKITGNTNYYQEFLDAEKLINETLANSGINEDEYEIVNPLIFGEVLPLEAEYADFTSISILALKYCTHIFFLESAPDSNGAKIESIFSNVYDIKRVSKENIEILVDYILENTEKETFMFEDSDGR